ncbi:hypothetical protein [Alteromonas macleodii]|uniref:hypothetical protein n=1 Tax=Alteromonas macleodii TaxID=28108 RepID=UPI0022AE5931|nr:hypothetical protein [Alteromonas macleodii]MCZ4241429.1 hypothetical protein [Alteromonas macleodii]
MTTEMKTLKDTVNALEALTTQVLSSLYSPAQAEVMISSAKINYTEEAVEARRKQEEARAYNEALRNAVTDFKDKMRAAYWDIALLSDDKRTAFASESWNELKESYSLRKNSQQPALDFTEPTVEQLMARRSELIASLERINLTQAHDEIEFCERHLKNKSILTHDQRALRERQLESAKSTITRHADIEKELESVQELLKASL